MLFDTSLRHDKKKKSTKQQRKDLRLISAACLFHSSLFTFILPPSGMGARSPRVQKYRKRHCRGRIWNPPCGMSVRSHRPKYQKHGKQPILGRGGACSSRVFGSIPPCSHVRKNNDSSAKPIPHVSVNDFVMMPDHIHATIFLHKTAGASPRPTVIV